MMKEEEEEIKKKCSGNQNHNLLFQFLFPPTSIRQHLLQIALRLRKIQGAKCIFSKMEHSFVHVKSFIRSIHNMLHRHEEHVRWVQTYKLLAQAPTWQSARARTMSASAIIPHDKIPNKDVKKNCTPVDVQGVYSLHHYKLPSSSSASVLIAASLIQKLHFSHPRL